MTSAGLILAQKAFLIGLFSAELIFGGDCYRKEFCFSLGFALSTETAKTLR